MKMIESGEENLKGLEMIDLINKDEKNHDKITKVIETKVATFSED